MDDKTRPEDISARPEDDDSWHEDDWYEDENVAKGALTELDVPDTPDDASRRTFSAKLVVALVGVALVLGVLFGRFVLASIATNNQLSGVTTLAESEIDTVIGTYTYNGTRHEITVREVIEASMSLDAAVNSDGTYSMPTADEVLSYARNEILNVAVEDEGIEVTDEEVDAFAEDYLGSSDYASIASQWGVDEESAEQIVRESCAVYKLRQQIVGEAGTIEAPELPEECASGEEDLATAEYGAYIVGLLGDEWDTEADTWARTDGSYYAALGGYEFSSTSATYNQAIQAYYVAWTLYSEEYAAVSEQWTDYVNTLLSTAEITIYSLVA